MQKKALNSPAAHSAKYKKIRKTVTLERVGPVIPILFLADDDASLWSCLPNIIVLRSIWIYTFAPSQTPVRSGEAVCFYIAVLAALTGMSVCMYVWGCAITAAPTWWFLPIMDREGFFLVLFYTTHHYFQYTIRYFNYKKVYFWLQIIKSNSTHVHLVPKMA